MSDNTPNLFVIGVAKSGTTTVHGILDQHPQVFMSNPKEPRFFSREEEYQKGFDWYIKQYFSGAENFPVRGEATPTYLFMAQKTAPRIMKDLDSKKIKFIAIFRNPIDRAYSHYWFNVNTKLRYKEVSSFETALELEDERLRTDTEFYDRGSVNYAYFHAGLYAEQLPIYFNIFGRENFLTLLFEDLFIDNFDQTVKTIETFLEIENHPVSFTKKKESVHLRSKTLARLLHSRGAFRKFVQSFMPKTIKFNIKTSLVRYNSQQFSYPPMNPDTRKMLIDKFAPDIRLFEQIINRDLSHWQ